MNAEVRDEYDEIRPLILLLELGHVALAGQELLQACLSIDPTTGELEPEGFCSAVKLRRDGNDKLHANEDGGLEGALVRAARFEKLINKRVARNDDERELLAWVHQDPVGGKSLDAWFWAYELVEKQVEVDGEEETAYEMHWGEGEAPSCFDDPFDLIDVIVDWVNSLVMLALTWPSSRTLRNPASSKKRVATRTPAWTRASCRTSTPPSPIALPSLPCAPCGPRNFCGCGMIGWTRVSWQSHSWTSGRRNLSFAPGTFVTW